MVTLTLVHIPIFGFRQNMHSILLDLRRNLYYSSYLPCPSDKTILAYATAMLYALFVRILLIRDAVLVVSSTELTTITFFLISSDAQACIGSQISSVPVGLRTYRKLLKVVLTINRAYGWIYLFYIMDIVHVPHGWKPRILLLLFDSQYCQHCRFRFCFLFRIAVRK